VAEIAAEVLTLPQLESRAEIVAPLAPRSPARVAAAVAARPTVDRLPSFDGRPPESEGPLTLAQAINRTLHDELLRRPQALVFGEDVAVKGGVYGLTRGLRKKFNAARVFDTVLDEQAILGMGLGSALAGFLPIPEIQYLAYLHNAEDQLRGEAATLQFFSQGQYRNPMVVRVAGLGYQKGFGGHFHNDNSIAALRDIPGLVVGCASRGDDAAMMLRTLAALAQVDGRVAVFLEPIALYMTKDLHAPGDGQWLFPYPAPDQALVLGEGRVYAAEANDLVIFTYGNGVPMSLRAARTIEAELGWQVRVVDLRWLVPLNAGFIAGQAADAQRVLVVDEGRHSAGVGEGVITALVEAGFGHLPLQRVCGADTYTPLAGAAMCVLPSDNAVTSAARVLAQDH
jgi:2-oxoisovalerate dehydrogenase E1 component